MARVLIVEDDPGVRDLLCEALRGLGHEAEAAGDGVAALHRFGERRFDVVLTDLVMPRMDGIELTGRLRAVDPQLPVLMLTGQGSLDLMARAVNRGIADYIRKPFRLASLEQALARVLDAQRPAAARPRPRRRRTVLRLLATLAVLALAAWGAWRFTLSLEREGRREAAARPAAAAGGP